MNLAQMLMMGDGVKPIEFVASAHGNGGGTSLIINKPTGTGEGDLMVAVMAGDASRTWVGDTDWVEVADQGGKPSLRVAYKIAGASEPSSYTFTASSSITSSGAILTYRYAAYDAVGALTSNTNPLLLPSISPSENQSVLIAVGASELASITLGTPTGMTARATDNDGSLPSYVVCDEPVDAGATGTRSMSASTGSVAGIMLALKPA